VAEEDSAPEQGSPGWLRECAWCRRVQLATGGFAAAVVPPAALDQVWHVLCPDCDATLRAQIARRAADKRSPR
jgi:hypothetical protein